MVTCDYASLGDTGTVNYHPDTNSVTVIPATDQRVVDFVTGGGVIGPYIPPAPPPPIDQLDTAALNDLLVAPGSVDRAELRALFNHENRIRALEAKQAITLPQFVTALLAFIR